MSDFRFYSVLLFLYNAIAPSNYDAIPPSHNYSVTLLYYCTNMLLQNYPLHQYIILFTPSYCYAYCIVTPLVYYTIPLFHFHSMTLLHHSTITLVYSCIITSFHYYAQCTITLTLLHQCVSVLATVRYY